MKNIYQESIQAVENGTKFKVDFKTRSFKLNGQYIIQNSQYEGDLGVELCASLDEFLSNVEHLYTRYKHSIPSTMSECKSRKYFKALSDKDLEDEDMLFGKTLSKNASLAFLNKKAKLYENREGWRLIGMLKKMLDDNNIDVVAKMKEWRK